MFTVEKLKNPVYTSSDNTKITALVKFVEFNEELPFTASKDDVESHGRQIFDDLVAGKYGSIAEYTPLDTPKE